MTVGPPRWVRICRLSVVLGGIAIAAAGPLRAQDATAADASTSTRAGTPPRGGLAAPASFAVSANGRYLLDAAGRPFLVHGDTAWSLIAQLKREDAEFYLAQRRRFGFNTIVVSLLEKKFATNAPANAYGEQPFLTRGDFTTPNERYFAHADWVIERAAAHGMLVLMTPAYLGYDGGSEGWYQEMVANGPAKLRTYGRFLGRRYARFANIVWLNGGDYDPPDESLVKAIVDGIREYDTRSLHSMHCAPQMSAYQCLDDRSWLTLNNVYNYREIVEPSIVEYNRSPALPFILLESTYENEHDATTRQLRIQAYHALLSGAAGQVFGNNPIWHFDGPGIYYTPITWREALTGPGSVSMSHVRRLLQQLAWWKLVPDTARQFLVSPRGSGFDQAVAALTSDGAVGLVYTPVVRDLSVDLRRMAGWQVEVAWYDPSSGETSPGQRWLRTNAVQTLRPPGPNAADDGDWVLLLRALAPAQSRPGQPGQRTRGSG